MTIAARGVAAKLGVESILIVLSVLVGLAINQWAERRSDAERASTMSAEFRTEIAQNLAQLERAAPRHELLADALTKAAPERHAGETAFTAFAAILAGKGAATEPLREAAWETAVSTGTLRLLPYERASTLAGVYLVQRQVIAGTIQRLSDRFLAPQNFEPASRETMLRAEGMVFNELAGQEKYLMDEYRRALRTLGAR